MIIDPNAGTIYDAGHVHVPTVSTTKVESEVGLAAQLAGVDEATMLRRLRHVSPRLLRRKSALCAMVNDDLCDPDQPIEQQLLEHAKIYATSAYRYADAMLAARKGEGQ